MPGNIVNELLLSANELNIYGSSSLIEYTDKDSGQPDAVLFDQIKTNPKNVYQRILKNKFDKLKQQKASASDFNVRPVPK